MQGLVPEHFSNSPFDDENEDFSVLERFTAVVEIYTYYPDSGADHDTDFEYCTTLEGLMKIVSAENLKRIKDMHKHALKVEVGKIKLRSLNADIDIPYQDGRYVIQMNNEAIALTKRPLSHTNYCN